MVIWHLKQIGKVKRLNKWANHKSKKTHQFKLLSSIILHNNNKPFLNQIVTCNEKWILYDNQLSGWTQKKLQSTFQSHTVWWSAAHLIYYSFLNPSETITSEKYAQQIDEMRSEEHTSELQSLQ